MKADVVKKYVDMCMKKSTRPDGTQSTMAESMVFHYTNGLACSTSTECVLFDDALNMIHAITINSNPVSNATYPIKIFSGDYEAITQIEGIFSQDNLEKVINQDPIFANVSKEKKQFIIDWCRHIKNHAIQPIDKEPFFIRANDPTIIPMVNTVKQRETPSTPSRIISVGSKEGFFKALEEAQEDDTIFVQAINIDGPVKINKNIHLKSNGATINGSFEATCDYISINGFTFTDNDTVFEGNAAAMITLNAKDVIFTDNVVVNNNPTAKIFMRLNSSQAEVINNRFSSALQNKARSVIESSVSAANTDNGLEYITISDNTFAKNCCGNNTIGLFKFNDNAEVNIHNNIFERSTNAIRIDNINNAKDITINCNYDEYHETDKNTDYAGFMLFQASGPSNKDFSNMTVNIRGLVGPNKRSMRANGKAENQIWYTHDVEKFPEVNIY